MLHLQRLESTLSVFAEEADRNQVLAHLGRMALEFNRLASKVHRNEQRTSVLQVRGAPAFLLAFPATPLASLWCFLPPMLLPTWPIGLLAASFQRPLSPLFCSQGGGCCLRKLPPV